MLEKTHCTGLYITDKIILGVAVPTVKGLGSVCCRNKYIKSNL